MSRISATVANDRFAAARDKFLASVPEHERKIFSTCDSRQALLLEIEDKKSLGHMKNKALAKPLERIHRFSRSLESYFKVVEIFIQSNPQYTAILWGAFRLVLQLASNFTMFFEKLAALLESLSDTAFFQYESIIDALEQEAEYEKADFYEDIADRHARFRIAENALCDVYVDIFELFRRVWQIFTRKDGRSRRGLIIFTQLVWKPFDATFSDLSARFQQNRNLLNITIGLNHYEEASRERLKEERFRRKTDAALQEQNEEAQREQQLKTIERVQAWLAPPEFKVAFETAQELRYSETATWLFELSNYKDWRNFQTDLDGSGDGNSLTATDRMFWVSGKPGSGKTITAAACIQDLRQRKSLTPSLEYDVYYYFFSQVSRGCEILALDAYRAIAFQLLQHYRQDKAILDKFGFAMYQQTSGPLASKAELLELLKLCFDNDRPCFLVLDGVDECSAPDSFLKELETMASGTPARCLFFSRPNVVWLRKNITEARRQSITPELNQDDICRYVRHKIAILMNEDLFPSSTDISNIIERLVRGSNGMFLWARLMFTYLESPALTSWERLTTISEVELIEGLDGIYERILEMIHKFPEVQRQLARRVFLWLTYAKKRLDNTELQEALTSPEELRNGNSKLVDFDSAVVLSCGSLVEAEIQPSTKQNFRTFYQFIHLSAKEYLSNVSDSIPTPRGKLSSFYCVSMQRASLEICFICLGYLMYHTPAQPLSGQLDVSICTESLEDTFPFLRYASTRWVEHLLDCSFLESYDHSRSQHGSFMITQEQVLQAVSRFLGLNLSLMAWVESQYTFGSASRTFHDQRNWAMRMLDLPSEHVHPTQHYKRLRDVANEMLAFTHDLLKINADWKRTLNADPHKIWGDVTAFTSSRFLRSTSAVSVKSLAPELPPDDLVSGSCLCTISQNSSGGTELGILTIFPSKVFAERDKAPKVGRWFSNWVIKYEIRELRGTCNRKGNFRIPMEDEDLILQFGRELNGGSRIHFPCSISSNINVFSVLRRVFTLRRQAGSRRPKFSTAVLPRQNRSLDYTLGHGWSRPQVQDYTLRLSPNGKFIVDSNRLSLDVYEIMMSDAQRRDYLRSAGSTPNLVVRDLFCFHPRLPLAAFAEVSSLKLWNLSTKCHPTTFQSRSEYGLLMKDIRFSTCGKHLVIADWDSDFPEILSLEEHGEYRQAKDWMANEEKQNQSSEQTLLPTKPAGGSFHTEGTLVTTSGDVALVSTATLKRNRNQLTMGVLMENGGEDEVSLLDVPNWSCLKDSRFSVSLPKTAEDKVDIVFNAVAQPWYDYPREREQKPERSSDQGKEALPILVSKDTRAIRLASDHVTSRKVPFSSLDLSRALNDEHPNESAKSHSKGCSSGPLRIG
ncbi:hypothetical protein G7Y89_g220 [Cudoniella acicularis]|uniref:NACHT domain-containing protein n=1 Tax=Cudoniella acicularis TaxID=354080 RepID=A0A8H4RXN3_9HELO|nr:hypothetical protein G7Y89_g220 [Cudoniella acicularis]